MKKTLLVLVMIVLSLSLVFAGGKKESKNADGKLNISVFTIQQRAQPASDNKTYKWLEDEFGATFEWDILVGDKEQKIGTLIASGDLPDMVEVDSERFQSAGCLIDLKPLIEKYAPNIYAHYKDVWDGMVNIDGGHVYSMPNYGVYNGAPSGGYYNQNAWWIQKCVLKEFGYPVIKTIDEYFDLLEDYKNKYPTVDGMPTIAFSILCNPGEAFNLWNPPTFLAGNPNDGNGHVVANKDGTYTYVDNFVDDNAYKCYKLLNGYFQRGLIDPECFTDTGDQYRAKMAQGRVLGMFMQGWQFMGNQDAALELAGHYERTWAPLAITFDESIEPWYRDRDVVNYQRGYGITVNAGEEKAIKILQLLDKLLEPENYKKLLWGFEGEDYFIDTDGSITGEAGRPYKTQQQIDNDNDADWRVKNKAQLLQDEMPKWEGVFPDGLKVTFTDNPWMKAATEKALDRELWDAYGVDSYAELMDKDPPLNAGWYPMWQCNPAPESDDPVEAAAGVAMNGFETIQYKRLPQLIMCDPAEYDGIWKQYVAELGPLTADFNKFMQGELEARVAIFGGLK